jgi:hypothetical protein
VENPGLADRQHFVPGDPCAHAEIVVLVVEEERLVERR